MPKVDDEILHFAEEEISKALISKHNMWKILIVDDEKEVHALTQLVLNDVFFEGSSLQFFNAYSAKEAKKILNENPDIAIAMIDVVMETDDAGLLLVKYIREELCNKIMRIILRTGQPGQAPEQKVIVDYDINDYKAKIELTAQKLFTSVAVALRSYRDICLIEKNRNGLEKIINSSNYLFELTTLKHFAASAIKEIIVLLNAKDGLTCFVASKNNGIFEIISSTSNISFDNSLNKSIPKKFYDKINEVTLKQSSIFYPDSYIGYFKAKNGAENILYVERNELFSTLEKNLISLFGYNVGVAFDNLALNQEIIDTQKEIIFTLGGILESRSKETLSHVRRVGELSYLLALKYGLNEDKAELLKMAAPMHDIGKVAISDTILNKPSTLTAEEFEIIKKHTSIGYDILKKSNRPILKAAAIIAHQHHERYDGTGYPNQLKKDEIHIYGKICGLCDVVDALSYKRVYKDPWSLNEIIKYVQNEKGKQFDPILVELFLSSIDEFIKIQKTFPSSI